MLKFQSYLVLCIQILTITNWFVIKVLDRKTKKDLCKVYPDKFLDFLVVYFWFYPSTVNIGSSIGPKEEKQNVRKYGK